MPKVSPLALCRTEENVGPLTDHGTKNLLRSVFSAMPEVENERFLHRWPALGSWKPLTRAGRKKGVARNEAAKERRAADTRQVIDAPFSQDAHYAPHERHYFQEVRLKSVAYTSRMMELNVRLAMQTLFLHKEHAPHVNCWEQDRGPAAWPCKIRAPVVGGIGDQDAMEHEPLRKSGSKGSKPRFAEDQKRDVLYRRMKEPRDWSSCPNQCFSSLCNLFCLACDTRTSPLRLL